MTDRATVLECDCLPSTPTTPPQAARPVSQMMLDLQTARDALVCMQTQVDKLKEKLVYSQSEVGRLKDQLLHQQQDHNAQVDVLLKMLGSASSPSAPNLLPPMFQLSTL